MLGNEALLVDRLCIYNKEHEKIADLNAKAVVDYVKLHGNLDYSHVFDEANYIERDIKVMKSLLADPKNGLGWQGERMVLESKGVDDLEKDSKHIALQKAKDFIFLPSEEVVKKYPDLERVYEMLTLLEKSNAGDIAQGKKTDEQAKNLVQNFKLSVAQSIYQEQEVKIVVSSFEKTPVIANKPKLNI